MTNTTRDAYKEAMMERYGINDMIIDAVMTYGESREKDINLDDLGTPSDDEDEVYDQVREVFRRAAIRMIADMAHALDYHGYKMQDVLDETFSVFNEDQEEYGPVPAKGSPEEHEVAEYSRDHQMPRNTDINALLAELTKMMEGEE